MKFSAMKVRTKLALSFGTLTALLLVIAALAWVALKHDNESKEQSTGVGQVGDAVSQMDQVTQQNAALVEEGAAAAESLRRQADQLVTAVSVFQLSQDVGR